ncbi:MAG: DUF4153 domain-containing protein [Roseobacter sp.]|nr:DUF4153 domain-containing protein [Roseobacter sp.]
MKDRLELAAIGAIAGGCLWAVFEHLPDRLGNGFLVLAVTVGAAVFFSVLMALVGPERPVRALWPSLILGALTGGLALWSGLRFESVSGFYEAGHPLLALGVVTLVGTPFAAATLEDQAGWRRYARLFDSAWAIFIRYVAGWLFAGLILVVLLLSDALLKLVGVTVIEAWLDIVWLRSMLIGAVFGLGVATVHELRDYVSPVLVHRLLRMVLPLVLVVVIVFLGALPFRGLSDLFGSFSTAGVLMAVAFAGVTLITAAIDRDDETASHLPLMIVAARLMALLIPVLVALANYAIWLRVAAYGWTPGRVGAAYIALFLTGYSGFYLWAVVRRGGWQARLRQSNLRMALAVWAGAVLWLTPLFQAEAIATSSQLARFEAGRLEASAVPVYELAQEWGRAGTAGLAAIEAVAEAPLRARIAEARAAQSVWAFERKDMDEQNRALRQDLRESLRVVSQGQAGEALLAGMDARVLAQIARVCPLRAAPSCALIVTEGQGNRDLGGLGLLVTQEGNDVFVIRQSGSRMSLAGSAARGATGGSDLVSRPSGLFEAVMAGAYSLETQRYEALRIGDVIFFPYNLPH